MKYVTSTIVSSIRQLKDYNSKEVIFAGYGIRFNGKEVLTMYAEIYNRLTVAR